jgi:hypothetical protein
MSRLSALRTFVGFVASTTLALGGVAALTGPAQAAKPTTPKPPKSAVTVTVDVGDTSADVTVLASYKIGDIEDYDCAIDERDISCEDPIPVGKNKTSWAISLTSLRQGEHTFRISIDLARKSVQGFATFETFGVLPTFAEACANVAGQLDQQTLYDRCWKQYATEEEAQDAADAFSAEVGASCTNDAWSSGGPEGVLVEEFCASDAHQQMRDLCETVEGGGTSGADIASCQTDDTTIEEEFSTICTDAGGYYFYFDDPQFTPSYDCIEALSDPATLCGSPDVGGVYNDEVSLLSWSCQKTYDTVEARDAGLLVFGNQIEYACDPDVELGMFTGPLNLTYACGTDLAAALDDACQDTGPISSDFFQTAYVCVMGDGASFAEFESICTTGGADFRVDPATTPPTYYCEQVSV